MRRLPLPLLLLLASCQPLPHPFADDVPPPRSLILRPRDSAGIVVAPVAGLSAPMAVALAEAMAGALRDAEIPASTEGGNKESYRLIGTARTKALARERSAVAVDWELRAATARLVGHAAADLDLADDALRQGDPGAARTLAGQAAPSIAKLIQDEPPVMVGGVETMVALKPVQGAPGDGGRSLTRAMDDALRRAHVALAEKPGDEQDFVLTGTVELSPPASGQQQVKVNWALARPDGREIGHVSQQNAVPAGSLDGAWGDIAYAVANAAAPGVAALIEKAKVAGAGS